MLPVKQFLLLVTWTQLIHDMVLDKPGLGEGNTVLRLAIKVAGTSCLNQIWNPPDPLQIEYPPEYRNVSLKEPEIKTVKKQKSIKYVK